MRCLKISCNVFNLRLCERFLSLQRLYRVVRARIAEVLHLCLQILASRPRENDLLIIPISKEWEEMICVLVVLGRNTNDAMAVNAGGLPILKRGLVWR